MRQWIEYAVENYRGKNSFGFQLTKDLRERQIEQAIERYARGVKPEEVVALMDTSVVRSGKTGFLFTDRYLYSDKYKEQGPVGLLFLKKVAVKPENNSCCVLTYEDGTVRDVDISVFLDVVDVLNMIISQKEEYEKEHEKESEETLRDDQTSAKESDKKESDEKEPDGIRSDGQAPDIEKYGKESVGMPGDGQVSDKEKYEKESEIEPGCDQASAGNDIVRRTDVDKEQGGGIISVEEKTSAETEWQKTEEQYPKEQRPLRIEVQEVGEPAEASLESESPQKPAIEAAEPELPIEIIQDDEFEESEDTGETREQRWMAELAQPENQNELSDEDAKPYEEILKKAESGDRTAMYQAAQSCYAGRQTDQDPKQALHWFRESAKQEYVPAMLQMMHFYREGELVKKNLTLSLSWAKKAAATGDQQGQYALVNSYIYGLDGKQDTGAGLALLSKMAEQGDESAQRTAEEVLQKIKEAKEQFDAGIKNPSTASGYYEMGMYCLKGDGYYHYPQEAVRYFQKAAEKEHVHAQYQLALAYHTGEGIKKDEDACIGWLEKASAKSHKEAGDLLRDLQEKRRIKKEKAEFKNHLRQAEKGDAYAQSKTAELYLKGIGVKQDIGKGIEWYEKASETDEGYAARQLARLYTDGEIIPPDPEKAAYWRMVGGVLDEL